MALYIPHSIFYLARILYVRPETFGPYYVSFHVPAGKRVLPPMVRKLYQRSGRLEACRNTVQFNVYGQSRFIPWPVEC